MTSHTSSRRTAVGQLGLDIAYVLTGLPLATAGFALVVAGLTAGVVLLATFVGLPILVATVYIARGLATIERARIVSVLRRRPVRPTYRSARPTVGWWRRVIAPLTDSQSWMDIVHSVVRFPVSVATFCVVVAWSAGALTGVTYWFWQRWVPQGPDNQDLPELIGLGDATSTRIWFYTALGAALAVTLPWAARLCAIVDANLAWALLSKIAELRQQITGLSEKAQAAAAQRVAAASAEATALHRLERDIHDGPQQRLVRLAVDLGRAQQQFDSNPAGVRQAVDEALNQAREAIGELRALSRGIAPPILADRGLNAAVSSLAAAATLPVDLNMADLGRLDPLVEQTAYFVIAEALANVAKHANASRCMVAAQAAGDRLRVTVFDDGVGGAHVAKGHGLAGLKDRVHSGGGHLWVDSPDGGPTEIRADVPCPSAG